MKKFGKLEIVDLAYLVFLSLFSLVALTELIKYLILEYTFIRACIVFAAITLLYVAQKNGVFSGKIQKKGSSKKKVSLNESRVIGTRRKVIKKNIGSWLSLTYLYGAFILYAVFVFVYMFLDISGSLFTYVSLAFIGYYILVRLSGQKIDISLPETPFSQTTFFKFGLLSFSLFLIGMFTLFPSQELGQSYTLIYLVSSLVYVSVFTFLFSRIFQNTYRALVSRKSKLWIISHTYFLLSGVIFLISFLLIAGKTGLFDTLLIEKVIPETYTPVVIEKIPQETQYQEVSEIRPLIEFYDIQAPLTVGDSGEEVTKLQQALALIGNYTQTVTGQYDEYTRTTLRDILIEKCDWPESTQGIVGPQAKACLDSIEVERKIRVDVSGFEGSVISNEVLSQ